MDKNALIDRIRASNSSIKSVSKQLSIDRSTFYRKLNKDGFTIEQASEIRKLLNLTDKDTLDIFLP